jgi:hypothetical protein
MHKLLSKIFPWSKIKFLEKENTDLKNKLVEKQEIINKTNAYWKKKIREISFKKSK